MSSKASVEKLHVEHEPGRSRPRRGRHCDPGHFFGLDAEEMGPKATGSPASRSSDATGFP